MPRIEHHLPHGDKISGTNKPELIVVHAMAEFICDPDPIYAPDFLDKYEYSAHSLITPSGDNIRCRNDIEFAQHAQGFNIDSLGIEFLVEGEHDYASFLETIKKQNWLNESQYQSALYQVKEWMSLYDIKEISRHSDKSPGRKLDPGDGFPWNDFLSDLGL